MFSSTDRIFADLNKSLKDAGIEINGTNLWDPQTEDVSYFFERVVRGGMLSLGEMYFKEASWDCSDLRGFFIRGMNAGLLEKLSDALPMKFLRMKQALTNRQGKRKTAENLHSHYGLGNFLYEGFLDPRLTYTCAYWDNPLDLSDGETLDSAQRTKLHRICEKLELKPGDRLLDIGCGWGSLAGFAAEFYGVSVVAITPVRQQAEYVRNRYRDLDVEVVECDFRDLPQRFYGQFDAVVSVGMFEHVGRKNYPTYMEHTKSFLKRNGISMIHCFGLEHSGVALVDSCTERYIFPGIDLPTLPEILSTADRIHTVLDIEEMGQHYDKTLIAWHKNFLDNWGSIEGQIKGDKQEFFRMWTYYLQIAAAAFASRKLHLWQIVMRRCDCDNSMHHERVV